MHTAGFVDPSWPDPHAPGDADIIIYGYVPSQALCVLALTLFSIGLLVHSYQIIYWRAWYLTPIPVACAMELVGYAFRFESAHVDPYRINFFVLNYFFIVVAPVFLSAAIYVCLAKTLQWAIQRGYPSPPFLRVRSIIIAFVVCDMIATSVQVTGAALIGHAESNGTSPTMANNILLSGLAFQSACFLTYLLLLGFLTFSILTSPLVKKAFVEKLGIFSFLLWTASILVFIRTLFRLSETSEGLFAFAMVHEVFFGTLDFAPIIVSVFVLAFWSPGKYLQKEVEFKSSES